MKKSEGREKTCDEERNGKRRNGDKEKGGIKI